jgi:hypothetical protein
MAKAKKTFNEFNAINLKTRKEKISLNAILKKKLEIRAKEIMFFAGIKSLI